MKELLIGTFHKTEAFGWLEYTHIQKENSLTSDRGFSYNDDIQFRIDGWKSHNTLTLPDGYRRIRISVNGFVQIFMYDINHHYLGSKCCAIPKEKYMRSKYHRPPNYLFNAFNDLDKDEKVLINDTFQKNEELYQYMLINDNFKTPPKLIDDVICDVNQISQF